MFKPPKPGDRVKVINVVFKSDKHLINEEGIVVRGEKEPDWRFGDICVKLNFDPGGTYMFRGGQIQLIESGPPEYIPVGNSIDLWIKNPEFKIACDALEEKFRIKI